MTSLWTAKVGTQVVKFEYVKVVEKQGTWDFEYLEDLTADSFDGGDLGQSVIQKIF